ncbi:MAG: hypothetical protein IPN90_07555 [Elusimicrobia bacterium]|nr:hypothetical protein [Elusimicrobiota bacterium]
MSLGVAASVFISFPAFAGGDRKSPLSGESARVLNEVIVRFKTSRALGLAGDVVFEPDAPSPVRTSEGKWGHELRWNTGGLPSGSSMWTI